MAQNRKTAPTKKELLVSSRDWLGETLPPGWRVEEAELPAGSAGELSGLVRITSPDGNVARIAVSVSPKAGPREALWALNQLQSAGVSEPVLLLARYLSPRVREMLKELGASFWDATGNARIVLESPGLMIQSQGGSSDPWRGSSGRPESLRGLPAARVVRALADYKSAWRLRSLAAQAGTSLGSTARTVELLEREGLIRRDSNSRISGVDWAEMIRLWSEEYELLARRSRTGRFLCPRGLPEAFEQVRKSDLSCAWSGSLAARQWAPYADAAAGLLYVRDLESFEKKIKVVGAEGVADLLVIEPADDLPFQRTVEIDGATYASPSQVAADLLVGPGRNPSEGVELLEWMKANEASWRNGSPAS